MINKPLDILSKYWNYPQFREPQEEIINTVIKGENSVVLLPTGGGKSLCYQVPALALEGVCIVISPLIALIHDQVNSLLNKNIKAIALTSQLNQEDVITAFDNLQFGNFKFLYLSPEKLQSAFIQKKIKQLNVSIVAIDEAHCISEWGHDFRPSYLNLKVLKELQPKAVFMALTATATQKVLEDIQLNLELDSAVIFQKSFQRLNLNYHVITTENIYGKLLQILRKLDSSVIIYTNSRKQTKEVCRFLLKNNFKSSYYHGGLSVIEKNQAFSNWMQNITPVMVATNAFGMGIDKPDVRAVIHINTPNSLENFIQEAGRAGRDGKAAYSLLLTNKSNIFDASSRFSSNVPSTAFVKIIYNHLNQYYSIALGETPSGLFNFSLQEFCETYKLKLLQTFNAIKVLERENIVCLDENFSKKSTLKFIVNNNQVFNYLNNHPTKNSLIKLILRSYGGIFDHFTIINEFTLSKKLKCSKNEIIEHLNDLNSQGIVYYSFENTTSKLSFLAPRDDNHTINLISKNIEQQNKLKQDKLEATIHFIQNNKICRNIQLLSYFDEDIDQNCENCDVCKSKSKSKTSIETVSSHIIALLQVKDYSSQQLTEALKFNENEILNSLTFLLEKNKITITSQNKYKSKF